jgi:hypothetical protein
VIYRKASPISKDPGKLRYVVERTFSLLHHFNPGLFTGVGELTLWQRKGCPGLRRPDC